MKSDPRSSHVRSNRRCFLAAALLVSSLLLFAGCVHPSQFETTGGGHRIFARVEGPHVVESHATHAVISSPFGVVTIEHNRARIDQGSWEKIPENVAVEMRITKHKVSIHAGAVTITRTM
jgi:hypothetical protein